MKKILLGLLLPVLAALLPFASISQTNPAQSAYPVTSQAAGKIAAKGMEMSGENFYTFPQRLKGKAAEWKKYNQSKEYDHPEFGLLPDGAPCETCVEVYDKRKADERYFRSTEDTSLFYQQKSLGILNALVDGRWVTVDHKLKPGASGVYYSSYTAEQVSIDVNAKEVSIQTAAGKIAFNNWNLLARRNGKDEWLASADWSRFTAGEDGIYITNIFKGIDAELRVFRGAVKTNFIMKTNEYGVFDALIFRDDFNKGQQTAIAFSDKNADKENVGQLTVYLGNKDALRVNEGVAYAKNAGKWAMISLAYAITDNQLDVIVPSTWINDYIGKYELVIDPLVTGTATLAQASITGSAYSATCFVNSCNYTLNAPVPATSRIVDVQWSFTYIASGSCWKYDGAVTFSSGACNSPSANGYYFFCNSIGSGTCAGNNISIYSDLASCLPAPSCNAQSLPVTMRFYRCYSNTAGCSNSCIGASSPWTMTIIGRTVEFSNPATAITIGSNICEGQPVAVQATGATGGVSPYNYSWSLSSTGAPVIATGSPASITFPASGSHTLYATITDACGITATASLPITVNPKKTATATITICSNQLPYSWNGQTLTAGGNGIATFTTSSLMTGCDSTTTLNLVVNPLLTATETITICSNQLPYSWNGQTINAGGTAAATYTMASLVTGCDSTTTLNLVVNPLLTATETITICTNQLPYSWNGQTINAGGTAAATYTMASLVTGCDSTTTLNLVVTPAKTATETITICANQLPYSWNGQTFTAGGNGIATFTTASVENGCDSTTTLNLVVTPAKTATETITICANQLPYSWNGQTLTAGGNSVATFTTASVENGCDSTITLNLVVMPVKTATETITICSSQLPYSWNGQTLTAGGNSVATFTTASVENGCDSITTLNLVVTPAKTATETIIICSNQLPYSWNGQTLTAGGNGVATFTTISAENGCDSTTTLNLVVNSLLSATETITVCANQLPYTWNGQSIPAGGNGIATFTTSSLVTGCDSTTTLNLVVNSLLSATETITVCANQLPYNWNGQTIATGGGNVATFTTFSLVTGCDSTTTLNLVVNSLLSATETITVCANQLPYNWNGQTIATGGGNVATFTTFSLVTGCDSTTTLNLVVNPLLTATETITICSSQLPYSWNGQTLTAGGNGIATFTTSSLVTGCDSTTTLNLLVNPLLTATETITICSNQLPYSWNGQSIATGGSGVATFTTSSLITGCDSTTTLNLLVNQAPSVSASPTDVTIFIGDNASFTVTGSGTGPLAYQWEVNDGSGFAPVIDGGVYSQAATPVLQLTNAPLSMNGYQYRCVISGICSPAAVSNVAVLNVTKRTQTISFLQQSEGSTVMLTYGDLPLNAAATATSGLGISYSSSNPAVITVNATGQATIQGVGTAVITASQPGDAIYLPAVPASFTIQVNKKDLIITADDKARPYGENNPPLTISYNGFVYGETVAVITIPSVSTAVGPLTSPGIYPITLTGGASANYNLVLVNGTITIGGAVIQVDRQPSPQSACKNESATFSIAASAASPLVTISYQWQESNDNSSWQDIQGANANTYIAGAISSRYVRCVLTAPGTVLPSRSAWFTVYHLPQVIASKSNDLDCNFGSTQLQATGATRYTWMPATGLSNPAIANPTASPAAVTKYYVSGTDVNGCTNVDSITVDILTVRHSENMMANAFTPNGDGNNDCFGIRHWGVIEKVDFIIYNRAGVKVFQTKSPGGCWDGRYQGQLQPTGVYVYYIRAVTNCGPIERKGTVTLIR